MNLHFNAQQDDKNQKIEMLCSYLVLVENIIKEGESDECRAGIQQLLIYCRSEINKIINGND